MERSEQLRNESIGKLLVKFSLPAIMGMIVNALYNVVDRMFIGNFVGTKALSGLTSTFPITCIIMAFGMLVGIGSAACISIKLGQDKKDEAEKILGNAFILVIINSLVLTVLGLIFKEKLLLAFGSSKETLVYATDYTTIIILGIMLQNIGFALNNIIRAEGNPKIAMFTMLIGGVLNIILDYIFMSIFNFGIKGAAYATIISQAVNSIWVLRYFLGNDAMLKLKKENFKLDSVLVKSIFAIGMSPFAMQIASSLVTIIQNRALNSYGGYLAVGVIGAINSVTMMVFMPIFGINQGAQPIIGYNYGAKQYKRVKKTLKLAIAGATTLCIIGFLVIQLLPKYMMIPFGSDPEFLKLGEHAIKIYCLMIPIIGFQIVSSNFFQAIGKAAKSMILSLSRQVIILIPLILILPKFFKLDGVWIAAPVSDFLASLIAAVVLIRQIGKLNKEEKELLMEKAE
ncbi:MATE family efflux transporter [Clostridiaceae bacterium 14S0207]|nr:MATE family efflux transporter [Clostridiaceae bacterium 14S0207]